MKRLKAVNSLVNKLGVIVAAAALAVVMATVGLARSSAGTPQAGAARGAGKVVGIAFDGHQVSNLEQSIKFYQALDFHLSGEPTDWKVDEVANKLGGTKGAQSRTAIMITQSSVSDKPSRSSCGNTAASSARTGAVSLPPICFPDTWT